MKLTSWNCSSSPQIKHPETASRLSREKAALLSPLAAEINVFQEIANPGTPANSRQDWSGSHPGRGIGVISAGSYAVERVPEYPPGRSAHPLRVHGPQTFHLLAIWSRPQRSSLRNYCHEVVDAIEAHQAFLQEAPAVIAGDFNSNALWDRQVGERNHSYLVSRLRAEFGLKSAYHDYFQVPQGEEVHPTFYQYRHRDKPFHLDYCFVPDSWRVIGVHVGEWSKWHTYSDHCPLTVEISF